MKVDIIREIGKLGVGRLDIRELVEDAFKVLSAGTILILNIVYYIFVGRTAGGLVGVIVFPHLLSLQFLLTLISFLLLQFLKRGRHYNYPERFSLFVVVLSTCYNLFVSVLLGIYSIKFL